MRTSRIFRRNPSIAFALFTVVMFSAVTAANASGTLYASPSNIPPRTVGSQVEYQVKVANVESFNGWDIMVSVSNTVLDPQSVSLQVNLFTANFSAQLLEVANCVNGSGKGCSSSDGPGIVHSAAAATASTTGTASGALFTITYKVLALQETPVHIFNDVIVLGSTQIVHSTIDATYGSAAPGPLVGGSTRPAVDTGSLLFYAAIASGVAAISLGAGLFVRRLRRQREN